MEEGGELGRDGAEGGWDEEGVFAEVVGCGEEGCCY